MKLLDRYIGTLVLKGYMLVMLILLSIFSFLALMQQLKDVGEGSYTTADALLYVALTMPQLILDLAPVTALIGSLVALGTLAKNSELIAIRAGGASITAIGKSILKPAVALMILMYLSLQFIAPPLKQSAEKRLTVATSATGDLLQGTGLWSREGLKFINVRHMLHGRVPAGINIYEFTPEGRLQTYIYADYAETKHNQQWRLINVEYKILQGDSIQRHHEKSVEFGEVWPKPALPFRQLSSESLSLTSLYHYLRFLRSTDQQTDATELLLWQRCLLPISALAMALLSIPFGFGLLRSSDFAKKLSLGAAIGIMFYLANQIIASAGLLIGASPPLIALTPVVIVTGVAGYLLHRNP
ncbi:MAG: LPS export ABC transporter permease LptG [Gammaproteobacteria bacterium]